LAQGRYILLEFVIVNDAPIGIITQEQLDAFKACFLQVEKHQGWRQEEDTSHWEKIDSGPFLKLTCSQIMETLDWDWHYEGYEMAGENPFQPPHTNRTGHNLKIAEDDKTFYCHACETGGPISRLIALKHGIMRCNEPGVPKGDKWFATVKAALEDGLIDEEAANRGGYFPEMNLEKAFELAEDLKDQRTSRINWLLKLHTLKPWLSSSLKSLLNIKD
jgi:hypothetical protein